MRAFIFSIASLLILIFSGSCRKDFQYPPSEGNLAFSRDTVFLDTIFTNLSSSTRLLKVYNRNGEDLEIPSIQLAKGATSQYRLNVDGVAGKSFINVPILAQDSLFIFVETTIDSDTSTETNFIYTDAVQFDTGKNLQEVQLVTLVKDAIFLYPRTNVDGAKETITIGDNIQVEGYSLTNNQLNFSNDKPYVIYGYASVPPDSELVIAAGARIHFHNNSGIVVQPGASIKINGALSTDLERLENEVVFEGDRLEPEFSDAPGQWSGIYLMPGSIDNAINYLTIKNATIGLYVAGDGALQSPSLSLRNSQIYNSLSINLWARRAFINSENLVLGNAGNTSLYCNLGGSYTFTHATLANYWNNGFRSGKALEIDNFTTDRKADLTEANFVNCIIDGNSFIEVDLRNNQENNFNYLFKNCLLKFKDDNNSFADNPLYDFEDESKYLNIFLNQNTDFLNAVDNDFRIGNFSVAKGNANQEAAFLVPKDIIGIDRTQSADIGAYQTLQGN